MLPQAQLLTVLHVKPGAELDFRDPTLAAKRLFCLCDSSSPVLPGGNECGLFPLTQRSIQAWSGMVLPVALASPLMLSCTASFLIHSSTIKVPYPSVCRFPYLCLTVMG